MMSSQSVTRVRGAKGGLIHRLQVPRRSGTERVTPSLGKVAMIDQNHFALICSKIRTEAYTRPAQGAEVGLDDFFFQIQRAFNLRAHLLFPLLLLTPTFPLGRLCRKSFSIGRGSGVSAAESAGINQ
jgi:hypothetical protein